VTAGCQRLGRGAARLLSQVARGRTDLEYPFVADLHGADFRTSGLADVPDARTRDRDDPSSAGFAVVRRDRRGALKGLAIGVGAGWALEDDVAPWHPTDMKPPIVESGHTEGQRIIVDIGPTDEDLPPPWQRIGAQADLLGVRR
jgi:hypothetical protein